MNPLIEKYIKLATDHDERILNDSKKANRIHKEIMKTIELIKQSDNEVRNEFYELLSNNNESVKLWTAVTLLKTFEERALQSLKDIADHNNSILSITANMLIKSWEKGTIDNLEDWKNLPEKP